MVEGTVSQEREHACVPRNHLPQLIHPDPRSAEKELVQHLRSKRLIRRSRHSRAAGQYRGQIVDAISISERPAEVEDALFPVIGRGICSQAAKTVISQPWWNDTRVLPCSSKCPAKTLRRSSPR